MTNHWNDIANADVIMAIGSNPAENHPAAFGHITEAKERGAKLISVDPRFTRTSAKADIYARIRSGTDIAFVGGMMKWVLDDIERNPQSYNLTYITEYTNAAFLIDPGFRGPGQLEGLFSGYAGGINEADNSRRKYDKSTWKYQLDGKGIPRQDKTLNDPNCVFQLLKKQFVRYTPEKVSAITGVDRDTFEEVCRTFAASGKAGKSGTILYAMGTTQHTYGAQNIRSYAMLQLLLGNIGVAGGGINAMRGESNVQGSTDHCLLFHVLPGYLPVFESRDTSLSKYLERVTPVAKDLISANWWQNTPKYVVSLLKAWYGDDATEENDFGFHYLPKVQYSPETGKREDYSHISLFEAMGEGKIRGLMVWGQNPAVGGPNANAERGAMDNLDWLIAVDMWHTETANFWKRPGANPAGIKTEVFLLPALNSYEKEGSVTNSGRWMQWRRKCADGPGDAMADLDIVNRLMVELRRLYDAEGGPNSEAITRLTWDYGRHADPHKVAREVNGYDWNTRKQLSSFTQLDDRGNTASGNWLYCGSYTEEGNMAARRDPVDTSGIGLYSNWAWCWPLNRRIIYNRASVDLNGNPWDAEQPVIRWNPVAGRWEGDVPDGGWPPMAVDPEGTRYPFIMRSDGHAQLFAANVGPREESLDDGPLPEHYEPWESPVKNQMSNQQNDPAFKIWRPEEQGTPDRYPIVGTTYRVCEHWQGGQMTRNSPWLVELMPEMFVEMSEELAAEKDIRNGERVVVETARGSVRGVAIVTRRLKPFRIDGRVVHQIGMPWHWGFVGLSTGDSANKLTPHVGDANTMIPEYKAFLCDIRRA